MGNSKSTLVTSGVKQQATSKGDNVVYRLVAMGSKSSKKTSEDHGQLTYLMNQANRTKNYQALDEAIQRKITPCLYNNGRGKIVHVKELVDLRRQSRTSWSLEPKLSDDDWLPTPTPAETKLLLDGNEVLWQKYGLQYKKVCWRLDMLGAVGENAVHVCFLNATSTDADLAKRILMHFPDLINDIYTGDDYYGEGYIHLAIVNEDAVMVKWLLDHGADYHQRAVGKFLTLDDQCNGRRDTYEHEWFKLPYNTSYIVEDTTPYYGEYPLSFAASLGHEVCVRLLVAHGADPNRQDSNGCTVLHMLVIYNNKDMFDLLVDLGADMNIKNRQRLTPLTLAAKLARNEMYFHILSKIRMVYWVYRDVMCAGYLLKDIDSIAPDGKTNAKSAMYQVVYGKDDQHLDMLEGVLEHILNEKWRIYGKYRFWRRAIIFTLYAIVLLAIIIIRPGTAFKERGSMNGTAYDNTTSSWNVTGTPVGLTVLDHCFLRRWDTIRNKARIVLEVILVLCAALYLVLTGRELYQQGQKLFLQSLRAAPTKAMFILSTTLVLLMVPGRVFCFDNYEEVMGLLAIMTCVPYFLFFIRSFRSTGPFVVMVYRMLTTDLVRFMVIYSVFVVGFSQAMHVAFTGVPDGLFVQFQDSFLGMFILSLGDFEDIYATFDQTRFPLLTKGIFLVYMVMVTLLMMNLLIAMMAQTYAFVNTTKKEYLRQWAAVILVIEQTVTTAKRLEFQQQYTQPMDDPKLRLKPSPTHRSAKKADRVIVIRWHLTDEENETHLARKKATADQARGVLDRKFGPGPWHYITSHSSTA